MFGNGYGMPNMQMLGMMGMPYNMPNMAMMQGMPMQGMPMQGMPMQGMPMQGMNMNNMNNMQNMQNMMDGMMGNPNMNVNMPGMNIGGNENWLQGYNQNSQGQGNNTSSSSSKNKLNCIFSTTSGQNLSILIEYGKTVHELIKIYFMRVEKPELINEKDKICFVYNAGQIDCNCQDKVENYFKFNSNPRIMVNDIHNLIGA